MLQTICRLLEVNCCSWCICNTYYICWSNTIQFWFIRFADGMNKIVDLPLFMQFGVSGMMLCSSLYQISCIMVDWRFLIYLYMCCGITHISSQLIYVFFLFCRSTLRRIYSNSPQWWCILSVPSVKYWWTVTWAVAYRMKAMESLTLFIRANGLIAVKNANEPAVFWLSAACAR